MWKAEVDAKRLVDVCYGSKQKQNTDDDDLNNMLLRIDFDRYDIDRDSIISKSEFELQSRKDGESESTSDDLKLDDLFWTQYSKRLREFSCAYNGVTQTLQSTPSTRNLHAACKFISGQPHFHHLLRHMRYLADVKNVRLYINFNVKKDVLDRTRSNKVDVERKAWKKIEEYKINTCKLYEKQDNRYKKFDCSSKGMFQYLNLPIEDYNPPSVYVLTTFLNSLQKVDDRVRKSGSNESVYWHCTAGYGRSGFMLACYLWDKENYNKSTFRYIMEIVKDVYSINAYEEIMEDKELLQKRLEAFKLTQEARNKPLPEELKKFSCEEIAYDTKGLKKSIKTKNLDPVLKFENGVTFQEFCKSNRFKNACNGVKKLLAISCNINKTVMQDFALTIKIGALPQLLALNLSKNQIDVDGMTAFAATLAAIPKLQKLHLGHNQIGYAGAQAFATACGNGAIPQLKDLLLTGNKIGDAGMQAFAAACGDGAMANLTDLTLADNEIGDAGMQSFATAIGNGAIPQLTYLDLEGNEVGDAGMQSFATAIGNGAIPQLTYLNLEGNEAGDAGMQAFAAACSSGALPALEDLTVNDELEEHPQLVAACKLRGIDIV